MLNFPSNARKCEEFPHINMLIKKGMLPSKFSVKVEWNIPVDLKHHKVYKAFKIILELLKLSDIRQLELGKLMFSLNHSLLPSKFNNYFSLNKQVHSYATRHANDFHLPFCRTNLRKFSVSFQGPTYYNSIENDIKESNSLHLFKTKLKKKLYMNY